MKRNKNEQSTGVRKRISSGAMKKVSKEQPRKAKANTAKSTSQLESSIDTASMSSGAHHHLDEESSYVSSEISSVSSRSHQSLSFIRAKSLYNLAQEMNALVDEVHDLDYNGAPNQKEGPMISGSVSDDDLDNLQRELANADEEFGGMFVDWDGKSIVVVQAESQEGITDIPDLPPLDFATTTGSSPSLQCQEKPLVDSHYHASLVSLDESKEGPQDRKVTMNSVKKSKNSKNLTREESSDFQPPAHGEHAHEIHLAPVSLKESTEGLQEEANNRPSKQPTKPAALRQLEEILAVVQEENQTLRTQMDQLQEIRTKEEEEYDQSMQEVEDKILTLMKRLRDKQTQYNDAMKQARDERASLEQRIQTKEGQIQAMQVHFDKQSKEEAARRKKLEKALNTVQRDLERVDSNTSDMVQELDDASSSASLGNSSPSNRSLSKRDADGWCSSPTKAPRQDSLSDQIPEALTINHVLHMCQSPPKVSRKSKSSFGTPPDMVHEIMIRNEKAVQVLQELKTKAQQKNKSGSIALDYGHAEPLRLDAKVQSLRGNHMELVSQLDQESDLLTKQLTVQREIIARLETKQKTMMENSRQTYQNYESELSDLRATYDEQLATFAKDNEALNERLAGVTSTIETLKSRHKKEISNLKLERHEIEKELLADKQTKTGSVDRFQQENESLSRQLVQYNKALDKLRSGHELEIKAHEANQIALVEELKKLQSKYESTVGTFHRQKEILMLKLIEKERAISEIEVAQENTLKERQEEKERLEDQLQNLDERCTKMKRERAELLQAQKQKFELLSVHLKELKAIRDLERKAADQRIVALEGKLESLQQSERAMPKTSGDAEATSGSIKSGYDVAVEESDTSRTSCLDPMVDQDEKGTQDGAVAAVADEKVPKRQSYTGAKRTIVVLLVISVIFAYIRMVRVHEEEIHSMNRKLALLQGEVKEWKAQDAAKDATNLGLRNSLERANSKSLSHEQEALNLADQLRKLQVQYQLLQQQHADHLESYFEETSHEPLPRCFSSPTLAMVASFEEELKNMIRENSTIKVDIVQMDTSLDEGSTFEEGASNIQEEATASMEGESSTGPVQETGSFQLVDSPATVFELSKAALEPEFFLLENLGVLAQMEFLELEMPRLSVASLLDLLPVVQDGVKDGTLRIMDHSIALAQSTGAKLKNRLLPKHRRLIKSEEGVWLEL